MDSYRYFVYIELDKFIYGPGSFLFFIFIKKKLLGKRLTKLGYTLLIESMKKIIK